MGRVVSSLIILTMLLLGCGQRAISQKPVGVADQLPDNGDVPQSQIDDEKTAAPLLVRPERTASIEPYEMPKPLQERLQQVRPDLIPPIQSSEFKVVNQHLKISSRESKMTFTGTLKINGRQDEVLNLTCAFDKSKVPWYCTNMLPSDEGVAAQRRLQASVECSDSYRCNQVSLELFIVIDGKTHSQLFQSEKFFIRRSSSGDIDEAENFPPRDPPVSKGSSGKKTPPPQMPKTVEPPIKVQEKPTRAKEPSANTAHPWLEDQEESVLPEFGPDPSENSDPLSPQEILEIMEDPNAAIEFTPPVLPPSPTSERFSIPGIEKLRPQIDSKVPEQAIGRHNNGYLMSPVRVPDKGEGFICRKRANRSFAANLMAELLQGAAQKVKNLSSSNSPMIFANIAKQTGGKLCNGPGRCHASHQTGLDVDVVFPSTKPVSDMWNACSITVLTKKNRSGREVRQTVCRPGSGVVPEFDESRFWEFSKHITCAEGEPVIAMFVDAEIKKHLCRWVRAQGEDINSPASCAYKTLRAMKHSSGHYNHVHIRLRCPGNRRCQNAEVTLGKGVGC